MVRDRVRVEHSDWRTSDCKPIIVI